MQSPPSSRVFTLVIGHPEPIVRYGLGRLLEGEPDLEVVGEADSGPATIRTLRRLRPDVALIGQLGVIDEAAQHTAVIVLAEERDQDLVRSAMRAGAAAYLRRGYDVGDVLRTVHGVAAGQILFPRSAGPFEDVRRLGSLSRREAQVLGQVGHGLSNKQVAHELGISLSTVKSHVSTSLAKLNLTSRTQLALYVTRSERSLAEHVFGGAVVPHARRVS